MAGKTLDFNELLVPDQMGTQIAAFWHSWDNARAKWKSEKKEIREYVFATDTTHTSNNTLPWSNKTHLPKICQIRDNLFANYMASVFPKRKWLKWEGETKDDEAQKKKEAIRDYMTWAISQKHFKDTVSKLILDYIDYGNCFGTVEWIDGTRMDDFLKPSYVGPRAVRIPPFDIVMNPTAPSVAEAPKIIRSIITLGEAKAILDQETKTPEDKEKAEGVWNYLKETRQAVYSHAGTWGEVDEFYSVDGFDSFQSYLGSNYAELLTFYGDFYDQETDTLFKNHMITVIDRHKVLINKPHPMRSGHIPIHHAPWRVRQDNNWAMGPLDNLIGMQYRIDHVENMKADIFDLTAYPPIKVRGQVEDFEWGPFERIYVDGEGDVELMSPRADVLTANVEIQSYEARMEEMAGSPKEAMGFRTPGEKTAYEVQRLENAASRTFQNKITQFEEQILEPILNDMLALAADNIKDATLRVIDDEFKAVSFTRITKSDLSAQGRIKPIAARHFAERAELIQNLTNFFSSPLGQDEMVKSHFSSTKIADMIEEVFDLSEYELIQHYVRLAEQTEAQRLMQANEETVAMEAGTPAGIAEDDIDPEPEGFEDEA